MSVYSDIVSRGNAASKAIRDAINESDIVRIASERRIRDLEREVDDLRVALALVNREPMEHLSNLAREFANRDGYSCGECGSNIYAQDEAYRVHRALDTWLRSGEVPR